MCDPLISSGKETGCMCIKFSLLYIIYMENKYIYVKKIFHIQISFGTQNLI